MSHRDPSHRDLHSEQGPRPGEHRHRSPQPVIKVHDIAWLEFEKPDLERTARVGRSTVAAYGIRRSAPRLRTVLHERASSGVPTAD